MNKILNTFIIDFFPFVSKIMSNIVIEEVLHYIAEAYSSKDINTLHLLHQLTDVDNLIETSDLHYDKSIETLVSLCLRARDIYFGTQHEEDDVIEEVKAPIEEHVEERCIEVDEEPKTTQIPRLSLENVVNQDVNKILQYTDGSYERGRLGEDELINIIKQAKPEFIVTKVSATGHVGDIHVDDDINNIKYVVESKLKQKILKSDITKFIKDVETITKATSTKYVYGIFVSLNSDIITTIGTTKCDRKVIYLTKNLVSKDIFKLIFDMVPQYVNALHNIDHAAVTAPSSQEVTTTVVEYVVPDKVRQILATLQQFNGDLQDEEQHLNSINTAAQTIVTDVNKLKTKLIVRRNYVVDLNYEFTKSGLQEYTTASLTGGATSNNNTSSLETDQAFLDYIRTTPKSKINKKGLQQLFPQHITELASIKLEDLFIKFKPTVKRESKAKKGKQQDQQHDDNNENEA